MVEKPLDIENQILEAAKKAFVLKGYTHTSMGEIAKEVGISRTAMHYYFRTKEMLFEAILQPLLLNLLPNIGLIVDKPGNLQDKLPLLINEYAELIQKNPFLPFFLLSELNRDPDHIFHMMRKDDQRIRPVLRIREEILREMENGNIRKQPIIDVVTTFVSLMVFPFLVRQPLVHALLDDKPEEFDLFYERRKELTYQVMINLLKPDPEASGK